MNADGPEDGPLYSFRAAPETWCQSLMRKHLILGMKIGAGYGEVSSAWANRVQPANSKGGNWWQSPLCGAFPPSAAETVKHPRTPTAAGIPERRKSLVQ